MVLKFGKIVMKCTKTRKIGQSVDRFRLSVTLAKAGVQRNSVPIARLDSRFRGNDGIFVVLSCKKVKIESRKTEIT